MSLQKITETDLQGKGVIGQPDVPGLSTTQMQEKVEEVVRSVVIPKFNSNVDEIAAQDTTNAALFETKVDKIEGKGLSTNDYTNEEKTLVATIPNKVDKIEGKGLSANDYTDAEKTLVATIPNKVDQIEGKGLSTCDYTSEEKQAVATISGKADITNVLTKDNTIAYTPTADYHPVTKKYADDLAVEAGSVSSVFGRSGAVVAQAGDYTADQVGAVPTARTVNGKALSSDITLSAGDVGALASSGKAVDAAKADNGVFLLTHTKTGTVHALTGAPSGLTQFTAKFNATADFADGDSFTMDGTAYTATQQNGESLAGAYFKSGALGVPVEVDTANQKLGFKSGGGSEYENLPSPVTNLSAQGGNGYIDVTFDWPVTSSVVNNECTQVRVILNSNHVPQNSGDGRVVMVGKSSDGSYTILWDTGGNA